MGLSKIKTPYISINKLAEYMQATPARRQSIVKQMKEDRDFVKAYYQPVYNVIPKFIKNGFKASIIDKTIREIQKKSATTTWEKTDKMNSIEALLCLKEAEFPDLTDYDFVADLPKLKIIEMSGVSVGLKPDLYLRNKHSGKIGALKTHVQKTEKNRLSENSRQYVATLIKQGFLLVGYDKGVIDNNACISIDVFAENYSTAPSSYVKRISDLESSCKEISLWWYAI